MFRNCCWAFRIYFVVKGPFQLSNEQKLKFYGLYKQATEGNITSAQPYFFNVVERAKWDAWYSKTNKNLFFKSTKTYYRLLFFCNQEQLQGLEQRRGHAKVSGRDAKRDGDGAVRQRHRTEH